MSMPERVWTRFTKIHNGKELKLCIQELPKDKFEDIFDFMCKYLFPEEPLYKASKVATHAEILEEYKQVRTYLMMSKEIDYQVDACCLEQSADLQVVGLSIMVNERKHEPCEDLQTVQSMVQAQEIKTVLNLARFMNERCNIFGKFNVDAYYKGRGVAVHKDYRGLGIAGELLRVRSAICKERGVPVTSAWMTSVGTQIAATRLGWETVCELQYKDLGKFPGIEIEEEHLSCKLMAIRI